MTPQERKIIANYLWSIRSHKRILRLDSAPYDMTSEINSIKKMPDLFVNKTKAIIVLLMALLVMCVLAGCAQAYTEDQAIKAIIGEAEGEGYQGMLAIGCGIRNRGTLNGVYGLLAPRVIHHKYSQRVKDMAVSSWDISGMYHPMIALDNYKPVDICYSLIKGAQYWEGDRFPMPYWTQGMIVTAHIGHQIFFKEVK